MSTSTEDFERFAAIFLKQVGFIQRSCDEFDKGFEDEAIRIATTLRTIFHQTNKSTSLIQHLQIGKTPMLTSSRGRGDHTDYLSWVIDENSSEPVTTKPILGNEFREISIQDWWYNESVFVYNKKNYPRRKIILEAANTDGGAHVAAQLEKFYDALSKGMGGLSMTGNLTYSGPPPFEQGVEQRAKNTHLTLIRQFAHEFLTAIKHFDWANRIENRQK